MVSARSKRIYFIQITVRGVAFFSLLVLCLPLACAEMYQRTNRGSEALILSKYIFT